MLSATRLSRTMAVHIFVRYLNARTSNTMMQALRSHFLWWLTRKKHQMGGFWSKLFYRPWVTFLSAIIPDEMRPSDPKSKKLFHTASWARTAREHLTVRVGCSRAFQSRMRRAIPQSSHAHQQQRRWGKESKPWKIKLSVRQQSSPAVTMFARLGSYKRFKPRN